MCLNELKRRIQILKLNNADKLLSKIGIKSASKGKFEQEDEELIDSVEKPLIDYMLRIQEILEVSHVYILIVEYEMGQKQASPMEHAKYLVQFVFDNLEKPLIIPTDNYIQQTLTQLQNFDQPSDPLGLMNQESNFEDLLSNEADDIHY